MKNLKLNTLANQNLDDKEMTAVKGGAASCCCACIYDGTPGGSTLDANASANAAGGLKSPWCPPLPPVEKEDLEIE
jgi:natural product precursor